MAPAGKSTSANGVTARQLNCARAVLETVPSVMWFVRRQLRSRRAKGLSVPQFRVLLLVEKGGRAGLSDICNNLGVSMPTASRIVTGLVDKGFLDRQEPVGDRRCRPIRLTTVGQAALKKAWNGAHEAMADVLINLTPVEAKQMTDAMRLLERLIAAAPEL